MGRVADHLKKFHQHAAEHHGELAKCYGKVASFGKAAKSQMKDGEGDSLAECLQKIADMHSDASEFHKEMMAACEKVAGDDLNKGTSDLLKRLEHLENRIEPTRISAVTPTAPGVRAVPRAGQPSLSERPNVPVQFEHLVKIGDED
jgi:hypothetical protein